MKNWYSNRKLFVCPVRKISPKRAAILHRLLAETKNDPTWNSTDWNSRSFMSKFGCLAWKYGVQWMSTCGRMIVTIACCVDDRSNVKICQGQTSRIPLNHRFLFGFSINVSCFCLARWKDVWQNCTAQGKSPQLQRFQGINYQDLEEVDDYESSKYCLLGSVWKYLHLICIYIYKYLILEP